MGTQDKMKSKRILASVLMGFNFLNSLTPMGLMMQKSSASKGSSLPIAPGQETEGLADDYTAAYYQILDTIDGAIFSQAEAATIDVPEGGTTSKHVETLNVNDTMNINDGGTGTIGTMSNGTLIVNIGGTGVVETVSGGRQILDGGKTSVGVNSGHIYVGISQGEGNTITSDG